MDYSNLLNEATRIGDELKKKFGLIEVGTKKITALTGGQIEVHEFKSTDAVVKAMLILTITTDKVKCISILVVCRENNVVPHWTFEFVESTRPGAPTSYMYFVDFLSRVDLGVELDYVKHVYLPLSVTKKDIEGVVGDKPPTSLQLIQRCCHSPWASALMFPNNLIEQIIPRFNKFYEHFLSLTSAPLKDFIRLSDEQQLERDRKQRQFIYNMEVDPIWSMFKGVLGQDATDQLLNAYLQLGFN